MSRVLHFSVLAALVLVVAHSLAGGGSGKGVQYAFLVACGDYDENELKKLPNSVAETAEFRDVLLSTGFAANNVKFLNDKAADIRYLPLKAKIEKELALLLGRADATDTVVVVLNGHGLQFKGDKTGYFCPLDAEVGKRDTLVAMETIFAQLDKCKATKKLLLVNACRNDPTSQNTLAAQKLELVDKYEEVPKGIAALYSCEPGEFSYYYPASKKLPRSLFMNHLIEAWQGKYTANGPVTLEEVFRQVRHKTAEDADLVHGRPQTPQPKRAYDGEWLIARPAEDTLIRDMKFVRVPKGTFWMGWDSIHKKSKQVTIDQDFELAAYTVTQGQWEAVMGSNPSYFSRQGEGKKSVQDIADADLKRFPVEQVSWDDIQVFLKKLNERERGKGWRYRLPKEAEWEYACRGAATTKEECSFDFYFTKPTNDLSSKDANFHDLFAAGNAAKGANLMRTTKVGSYAPNKLGLYDMHGNVWQWCGDLYDNSGSARVLRGGSWSSINLNCWAAKRLGYAPSDRSLYEGFRLARVPSGGQ